MLDKFVGKYKAKELDAIVPVFREGDKLYVRTSFWDKVELMAESDTQFFGDSKNIGDFNVKFIMDKKREVLKFVVHFNLRIMQFDKIK